MEERGCLGCGCGCFSTLIVLAILFLFLICGLIAWAVWGFSVGQYQLHFGRALLVSLIPLL
jgi:hypothetical protein